MTREEYNKLLDIFKETGLDVAEYPQTYQINVTDLDGVVQTYYASKGTAVLRDGNDWKKSQKRTIYNMPYNKFLDACQNGYAVDLVLEKSGIR